MWNIQETILNNKRIKTYCAQQLTYNIFKETANAIAQAQTTFDEGNLRSI